MNTDERIKAEMRVRGSFGSWVEWFDLEGLIGTGGVVFGLRG